jgi:predicted enzyme related to lactoylglutathione lyase
MLQRFPLYAYIPVKDLARARQFYEQKVGLKPKEERVGGVVYEFADHTLCFMYPTPNAGSSTASQAFWQVDDVEHEVAELKRRGVKFEEYHTPQIETRGGIASPGDTKAAWFKDSEGNIMALIQASSTSSA